MLVGLFLKLEIEKIFLIISIELGVTSIFMYRKNTTIFIFNLFLITYYIPILKGYFFNYKLTPHIQNFYGNTDEKTMMIYSTFLIIYAMIIIVLFEKKENSLVVDMFVLKNRLFEYMTILAIIICIFLGHKGMPTMGYARSSTIFNEYIIILFLILYIVGDGEKVKRKSMILFLAFVVINFIYGDRIAVLQVGLMQYYLYINKNIDFKKVIILVMIVFIVFGVVDRYRAGDSNGSNVYDEKMINTNQSQVFNSSIVIVKLVDDRIMSEKDRGKSFIETSFRIVMKQEDLGEKSNLAKYSSKFNKAQGGGFISSFFFVWFGWIGVVLLAVYIASIVLATQKNVKNSIKILIVLQMSLYPRWLAYDPIQLFKIAVLGVLICKFIYMMDKKIYSKYYYIN